MDSPTQTPSQIPPHCQIRKACNQVKKVADSVEDIEINLAAISTYVNENNIDGIKKCSRLLRNKVATLNLHDAITTLNKSVGACSALHKRELKAQAQIRALQAQVDKLTVDNKLLLSTQDDLFKDDTVEKDE